MPVGLRGAYGIRAAMYCRWTGQNGTAKRSRPATSVRGSNLYHPKRTDANQSEIADGLRRLGLKVFSTHRLGGGFPDLVVFNPGNGILKLLEVKTASGRRGKVQVQFAGSFVGAVAVVRDLFEAAKVMGIGILE